MEDAVLSILLIAFLVFGYFAVNRLCRFLDKVRKGIYSQKAIGKKSRSY